jgi:microcystin-dependent protein
VSSQFLSEIRIMAFNYAPRGWAFANGQLMSIQQNSALFSLLGTYYGGNGVQTFGLPNLQGRTAVHLDQSFVLGQVGGQPTHTLITSEMPLHFHLMQATTISGDAEIPAPAVGLGKAQTTASTPAPVNLYGSANRSVNFNPAAVGNTGGGQAHDNMQPYLVLNSCVSLTGIFPSRN